MNNGKRPWREQSNNSNNNQTTRDDLKLGYGLQTMLELLAARPREAYSRPGNLGIGASAPSIQKRNASKHIAVPRVIRSSVWAWGFGATIRRE